MSFLKNKTFFTKIIMLELKHKKCGVKKMSKFCRLKVASCVLFLATIIIGGLLINSRTNAEGENDTGDEISCSVFSTVDESHTANLTPGIYTPNIGTSTFKVTCNDEAGFAIYSVGFSNNEFGNNKILADDSLGSESDISTGTATSGEDSAWAMKISAVAGTYAPTILNNFDSYSEVPDSYAKVAELASQTDDETGASIQSTYAVFPAMKQLAGNYKGKVKFTLVNPYNETPCSEREICYKKNANNVVGSMGRQTVTGTTATLLTSNFSHEGYGFAGWNTEADGTGTSYGPNETITLPNDMSEGLALYAMWVKSEGSLQDWAGCSALSIGDVTALTDSRNNDTYAVAKLADGNCWMIENLRLADKDSSNNPIVLSSSNTHNPSLPLTNVYDAGLTSNSLSPTSSVAYDAITNPEGWCSSDSASCDDQSRLRTDNTSDRVTTMTGSGQNVYSYGNYYNWYSATAGNGKYGIYQTTSVVGGDICPMSWHLPYGGNGDGEKGGNTSGGFYYLGSIMGATASSMVSSNIWRSYPNNMIYSGYNSSSSISGRGMVGYYWTSTTSYGSNAGATPVYFANSSINIGAATMSQYYGLAVRCVTPSIARQNVTVVFDDGVESVTLQNSDFGDRVITTSGTVVTIAENTEYAISAIYKAEKGFNGWTTTGNGTIGSASSAETTYRVSGTATLTLSSKRVCVQGYVCYDKNNDDASAPGGSMANQQVSGNSVTLWASNFGRNGYGFAGWNTEANGTGANYGPNETIYFDNTDEDGLMLYAMWVGSDGTLQSFVCPDDATMSVGTVIGLTDTRDGQVYAVAKLADSNCWMIENMRLANVDTNNNPVVLSTLNTNNPSLPLLNNNGSTSNSLSASQDPTVTAWCDDYDSPCHDKSMLFAGNTMDSVATMTTEEQGAYEYGNYYNWYSATAGRGKFNTDSEVVVEGDLCPAGWHLPYGNSGTGTKGGDTLGGFYYLGVQLGATGSSAASSRIWRSYPNNFTYSGGVTGSQIVDTGVGGVYWTATAVGEGNAFTFSVYDSYSFPGTDLDVGSSGRVVRCLSEQIPEAMTIDDLTYMQDFSTLTEDEKEEVLDSMIEDEEYQLLDSRDNKEYYIAKLADGNVWMTQNLDFDIVNGGANLNSTNTDVPYNWTDAGRLRNTYKTNSSTWDYYVDEPESYDPGNRCWNGVIRNDWDGNFNNSTRYCSQSGEHYHLGNYYNWTAAVAMEDSAYHTGDDEDVDQSICPAGWRLPKGGENPGTKSYEHLISELGLIGGVSGNFQNDPVYFAYTGYWHGNVYGVGSYGDYWTSTTLDYGEVYALEMTRNDEGEAGVYSRGRSEGYPVRCVAR